MIVLALAAGSADLLALHFSIGAMQCCLKARHECAGMKTADDCCQGMGHGIGPTTSTGPVLRAQVVRSDVAILTTIDFHAVVGAAVQITTDPLFKRPHDPPYLHPIPLLI
jgi:hypothetical protein